MRRSLRLALFFAAVFTLAPVRAQEPVTGVADPESLFTSPDPKLHANKQVVYASCAICSKRITGIRPTST